MASVVFVNLNAETITDSWTLVELKADERSPQSAGPYVDHIEIVGTPTNAPASLSWAFTYDQAGADPGPSGSGASLLATPGGTTSTVSIAVDRFLAWNRNGRTNGTVYLWLKTDGATKTLALGSSTGCSILLRDSRA